MNSFGASMERFTQGQKTKSIGTQRTYEDQIRHFLIWCTKNGLKDVSEINSQVVVKWLTAKDYSPYTYNLKVSVLKCFFEELGMIVPLPKKKNVRGKCEYKYRTEEEIKRIYSVCNNRKRRVVIGLLYTCGMRVSEMCSIKLSDINLDDGIITLHGKGGKVRTAALFGDTLKYVQDYIRNVVWERGIKSEYLFCNKWGRRVSRKAAYNVVRHIGRLAGIQNLSPHQLRHSFATHLSAKDMPTAVLKEALGHNDIKTTLRYTHLTQEHVRASVKRHFGKGA